MKIALINMPFSDIDRPSLGISQLKSNIENIGVDCDILYFNIDFLNLIGIEKYNTIHSLFDGSFTGEWLFSSCFYNSFKNTESEYIQSVLKNPKYRKSEEYIKELVETYPFVPLFINQCLESVNWEKYSVVGFTSMFDQTYSSLCLARELKKKYSKLIIGMGGANCEAEMGKGLIKEFEFLDFVSLGSADESFCELISFIDNEMPWHKTKGFITRIPGGIHDNGLPNENIKLDALPYPNFDEYFSKIDSSIHAKVIEKTIPFEASRGCWWGEKARCIFCGAIGHSANYKYKSTKRILEELKYLCLNHNTLRIDFVDSIINHSDFNNFIEGIGNINQPLKIFVEIRPKLNRSTVKKISENNITWIQPGLENFSDSILKLMKKGAKGLDNIALLKYCKIYNIKVLWSFIYGFPNENTTEFNWFLEVFKNIVHYDLPLYVGPIRLDRFSPLYTNQKSYSIKNVRPAYPYSFIFKTNKELLDSICFSFDFDYSNGQNPFKYGKELVSFWKKWNLEEEKGDLCLSMSDESIYQITDTRFSKEQYQHELDLFEVYILVLCDAPVAKKLIIEKVQNRYNVKQSSILKCLNEMADFGLTVQQNNRILSLVLVPDDILLDFKK